MGGRLIEGVITILVAIIGVAIIAVLVGKQANTEGVISSAATGFEGILAAATKPITGGSFG